MMTKISPGARSVSLGVAMLASVFSAVAPANAQETNVVESGLPFQVLWHTTPGLLDPNGPEFIVQYSTMHEGDRTAVAPDGSRGRAVDCNLLVAFQPGGTGPYVWADSLAFYASAADLTDSEDRGGFNQYRTQPDASRDEVIVISTILNPYLQHIYDMHHPESEVRDVAALCQDHWPPIPDSDTGLSPTSYSDPYKQNTYFSYSSPLEMDDVAGFFDYRPPTSDLGHDWSPSS